MALGLSADLNGQVAIVTGASQGLGETIAEVLAQNGATVVCVARNAEKLSDVVKRITDAGGKAEALAADVTDRAAATAAIEQTHAKHGRLDIVVNNAGVTRDKLLRGMSDEEWDTVIATNLTSCFVVCRAARISCVARSTAALSTWPASVV